MFKYSWSHSRVMSIELERMVSLVIFTNARLAGKNASFTAQHAGIRFARHLSPPASAPRDAVFQDTEMIARDADAWVRYLKGRGVTRLNMHFLPPSHELPARILVAFKGGGSTWCIEAIHGETSDVYVPGDATSGKRSLGNHLLLVGLDVDHVPVGSGSLADARDRLRKILEDLESFTGTTERMDTWQRIFSGAKQMLEGKVPADFDEIVPPSLVPEENRKILAAAFGSRVFGGMGSWNDLAFSGEEQDTYVRLSDELHAAMMDAIAAAVNLA